MYHVHTRTHTYVCMLYFNHIHSRYHPLLCSLPPGLLSFLSSPCISLSFKNLDSAHERNTQYSSDADLLRLTWWAWVPVHFPEKYFFLDIWWRLHCFLSLLVGWLHSVTWLLWTSAAVSVCCRHLYDTLVLILLGHSGVMLLTFLVRPGLGCLSFLFSTKFLSYHLLQILRN